MIALRPFDADAGRFASFGKIFIDKHIGENYYYY